MTNRRPWLTTPSRAAHPRHAAAPSRPLPPPIPPCRPPIPRHHLGPWSRELPANASGILDPSGFNQSDSSPLSSAQRAAFQRDEIRFDLPRLHRGKQYQLGRFRTAAADEPAWHTERTGRDCENRGSRQAGNEKRFERGRSVFTGLGR